MIKLFLLAFALIVTSTLYAKYPYPSYKDGSDTFFESRYDDSRSIEAGMIALLDPTSEWNKRSADPQCLPNIARTIMGKVATGTKIKEIQIEDRAQSSVSIDNGRSLKEGRAWNVLVKEPSDDNEFGDVVFGHVCFHKGFKIKR